MRRLGIACLAAALFTALFVIPAAAAKFLTIGTGGVTGVYYPVGKAIAKLINESKAEYGLKTTVESTGGSVYNINAVLNGDLDMGIAQSDTQFQAWHGRDEWLEKGPQDQLRSIMSLHPETFFLVASETSGINSYPDLKGKAVAVGNPGSGQRQNFEDILAMFGMSFDDFERAEGLKASESAKMLADGRVDAFVYTVGSPNGQIKEATAGRIKVRFIALPKDKLEGLTKGRPYYVGAKIPLEFYPMALNKKDVTTLAVKATLITRASVPDDVVYAVTKEVFENLAELKKLHEALKHLEPKKMLEGLTAPLHPGAEKYFQEAGLL